MRGRGTCSRSATASDADRRDPARTTGRTGVECIRELFGETSRTSPRAGSIAEKEAIYREIFAGVPRGRRLRRFAQQARARGLKIAVATAGDKHNIAFALRHLKLAHAPDAIVGGDEGLPASPSPPSSSKRRGAWARRPRNASCSRTRPSASRQRGAPACAPWRSAAPTTRRAGGPARDRAGARLRTTHDNELSGEPACVKANPK
jgi:hypothetical protein